jgi:enoyl-CoA hydratase/carnithine racemase
MTAQSSARADTRAAGAEPVLLRESAGNIAILTLNRPNTRNTLSEAMLAALGNELTAIAKDRAVRAVVLAATGPAFSGGHDLKELTARRSDPDCGRGYFRHIMLTCSAMMQQIVRLPQPVIAAVQATATAAGCQLVASCDLAVASAAAKFGVSGINAGLFCSTPMVALSRNVTRKSAMEMLLTGDFVDAAEALRIGLVNGVAEPAALLHDVRALAADIAAIHEEVPWTDLLGGMTPDAILQRDKVGLVDYYRSKNLQLMFMADLTDGLSRGEEAPQLRALGRSIAEPAVQQVYRDYVLAVARVLRPEYVGLAAETNLIRAAAPALYGSVRQAANAAHTALRGAGYGGAVFISVQVETAWGRLGGTGPFVGIATDRADFAFTQMIGLSSYPYFGYATPEDIPADYYSRLLLGATPLPLMQVEGGWPSVGVGASVSSAALQARYVTRFAALLDGVAAGGWIQLEFVDIDIAAFPPPIPPNRPLFVTLGFVDSNYAVKPALAQWDALFARPRV